MFLLIAVVVTFLAFYVQWYMKRKNRMDHLKKLPGSPPTFLIGNIAWIIRIYSRKSEHHAGVYILERIMGANLLYEQHGLHVFWIGSTPVVPVMSPQLIEVILSSNNSLEKSFEYSFLHKWLGLGLLTSTGPKWRTRRKLLTPCFHFRILEDFLPTFNEQSLILVKKLMATFDEEYVDIMPLIVLCTLDIVCETVMGAHIGAQKGLNSEYVTAVHNLGEFFNQRTIRPWLFSEYLFSLTKMGQIFDRDLRILHSFTNKVIKEKKESRLAERDQREPTNNRKEDDEFRSKKRQALMDLLLDLHVDEQQLTEEDIREEVDTFMFEGHDTTAMGLTYALYCIGLYPSIQGRIQEELDSIFNDDFDRPVTMDDVRNMKYLECVLKESQRLYPSVPIIGRKLNEDIKYQNMVIPKGTTVHCNIISLHRRSDIFPNPEVFDPDRFTPENAQHRHPYAYIPFSAGPRNCIGQKFALLEEKVIIANILRHLKVISIDPRDKVHMKVEFTLKPAQAIRLKFVPRR